MGWYNILQKKFWIRTISFTECCIPVNCIDFPPNDFLIIPLFANILLPSFSTTVSFLSNQQVASERWGVKFNNILISITFCFIIRLMLWHPLSLGRWGELQYLCNWGLDEGACNSMVSPQWADSVCHQFHQLQHCVHCHCWWGGVSTSLVLSHHPCHPPSPLISGTNELATTPIHPNATIFPLHTANPKLGS